MISRLVITYNNINYVNLFANETFIDKYHMFASFCQYEFTLVHDNYNLISELALKSIKLGSELQLYLGINIGHTMQTEWNSGIISKIIILLGKTEADIMRISKPLGNVDSAWIEIKYLCNY